MREHWVLSMVALHHILRPIVFAALSVAAYAATVMLARTAADRLGDHMRRIIFLLMSVSIALAGVAGYGLAQSTFNPAMWAAVFSVDAATALRKAGGL